MIQSSSIDEIVFHRLGLATLRCESWRGNQLPSFLGNCLRDILVNCLRGLLAIGLLIQILRGMMIFFDGL